jgi:hypothetical protein
MKLVGSNPKANVTGLDPLPSKSNYFIGNDPKKWRTNVPNYARVKYEGVYPGIDLLYYGNQGRLEYDLVVAPGTDPRAIALNIAGAEKMQIDPRGDLVLSSDGGDVRLHKPVVYQPATDNGRLTTDVPANSPFTIHNSQFVDGRFLLLAANRIGFEVSNYDRSKPLVIDPVLSYSTYLGGSGGDTASAVAVDADGNAYVTGNTSSIDFPIEKALQPANASEGGTDVFVTKLSPDGSSLVYSTYLGGWGGDFGRSIAVDSSGNAYVTGRTTSRDFPTLNAFQNSHGGGYWDAFVTKLDLTGSVLLYSTYLGGSGNEDTVALPGGRIAVDSSGSVYVTGDTHSTDFPTTDGAFDRTCGTDGPCDGGHRDVFVTKLTPDGSALAYSTYLGGDGDDVGVAIAVDSTGSAYVSGRTDSAGFPTTPGSFQTAKGAYGDAFVAKLNPDGSDLIYSTYLGGSEGDRIHGIAVDLAGNAYVTGATNSADFPTKNAFQPTWKGGTCYLPPDSYLCDDNFVTKLNPTGSDLVYSTYLGSSGGEHPSAFAVDASGNAYVTGGTFAGNDFPLVNPLQAYAGGTCGEPPDTFLCFDAFVCKLSPSGTLVFSTYLGATGGEGGDGIAVDPSGNIYVAGGTSSADFPITPGAFQTTFRGGDGFVVKIGPADNTPTGAEVNVTLTNAVALTFDTVGTSGTTALTRTNTGAEPPAGFSLGHPPTYYELSTTAVFSGSVEVCINYTDTSYGNESKLKLFHFEGGKWEDRTVSLDTTNDIICASVMSLSPFAVLEDRRIEAEGLKPPLADLTPEGLPVAMPGNAFKQGRTLPLRLGLFRDGVALSNADVSPPQIVALTRNGEALDLATMDLDAGQANDNGTLFRFSDGNWVYNLSTQGLSAGTYTITMQMPDGRRWNAGFVLR